MSIENESKKETKQGHVPVVDSLLKPTPIGKTVNEPSGENESR